MPLYDYKCERCHTTIEVFHKIKENPPLCDCGSKLVKLIQPARVRMFRAGIYEHIAHNPIQIDSMKQLKKECKKHGVTSAYAEDIC
ncbi:MAG: hypothetical protein COA94_04760 [Rickettsiales bacterium]|nr:MAG: hypothetical protein COA94_04760 [Rickettsiales bacterium]